MILRDKIISPILILTIGCVGPTVPKLHSSPESQDTSLGKIEYVHTPKRIHVLPELGDIVDVDAYSGLKPEYFFSVAEVSDSLFATMDGVSMRKGAPVTRADLRDVKVLHYDFDGNVRVGEIICHKAIAEDLLEIFTELYAIEYPIESIVPIDNFDGDDNESMRANNTSCFNFRPTPGGSRLSLHAYGTAIDINPMLNPYVRHTRKASIVLPSGSERYVDRSLGEPGMLTSEDPCVRIFKKHGFRWGGDWRRNTRDYQHFEKHLPKRKK